MADEYLRHLIRQELKALQQGGSPDSPEATEKLRALIREEIGDLRQWERKPLTPPSEAIADYVDEERHGNSLSAVLSMLQLNRREMLQVREIMESNYPGMDAVGEIPLSRQSREPDFDAERIKRYFEEADSKGKYLQALMYDRGLHVTDLIQRVAEELEQEPVTRRTANNWFERYTDKPELEAAFVNVLHISSEDLQHMDSLPRHRPFAKSKDKTAESTDRSR